jgi:putative spermidine/putrescine transport system substrate-binding protein
VRIEEARVRTRSLRGVAACAVASAVVGLAACAPPAKEPSGAAQKAGTATSASAFGGMDALVAAAKKEGTLNVIALPPDWANYGEIISAFQAKYGIKVVSAQPDADSSVEISTAKNLKGQSNAPDVFDLGQAVAVANTAMYAPYKVEGFDAIPAELKDPNGTWVNDYGGYISIGYDTAKVPAPKTFDDLLKPAYKGKVALNGNPTKAGAAFSGVVAASLGNGGSADDVAPGVDYFVKLKDAGNLVPVDPTPATIQSGQTAVVIDWDYNNAGQTKALAGKVDWKSVIPEGAVNGAYYVQAINKDAPHPAAARLWEEFLFSDAGQNLWLKGGARPVRSEAMVKAGTIDKAAYAALPPVTGKPVFITEQQRAKITDYLNQNWQKEMG